MGTPNGLDVCTEARFNRERVAAAEGFQKMPPRRRHAEDNLLIEFHIFGFRETPPHGYKRSLQDAELTQG
jgi:hypothetical protein